MGNKFLLRLFTLLLVIVSPQVAFSAGVTIITHGLQGDNEFPPWVNEMNQAVRGRIGGNSTYYHVTIRRRPSLSDDYPITIYGPLDTPPNTSSGEIIILLDWADISSKSSDSAKVSKAFESSTLVAEHFVPLLFGASSFPSYNRPMVGLPIHLIGHSRGGSVVSEISRLLGERGVWVDQQTTLDPRPVGGFYDDGDVNVYKNVTFADNYWRPGDGFNGDEISGAYNRNLQNPAGGYEDTNGDHSNVHLWYHGTIDTGDNASDGEQQITPEMRNVWWTPFESRGEVAGFFWSRLGNGGFERRNGYLPVPGGPSITSGYNSNLLPPGMGGARENLVTTNANWPNLVLFQKTTGVVSYRPGDQIDIEYLLQDLSNQTRVDIFLDIDRNPYNSGSFLTNHSRTYSRNTSLDDLSGFTGPFDVPEIPSDTYYLFGRITDGNEGHTRYLYDQRPIQVLPPPPNIDPELSGPDVDPNSGDTSTDFYWSVEYVDLDGDAPLSKQVYIDDTAFTMDLLNGSASNGTYRYGPKKLSAGNHNYYFSFTDGNGGSARLPTSGTAAGPPVTTPIPAVPASISYPSSDSDGSYTVSWAASNGATSYQLERSNNGGSSWSQVYSGPGTSYSESVGNGSYRYRVRATNSAGSSGRRSGAHDCVVNIAPEGGIDLTITVGLDPETCATESEITVSPGATVHFCYTFENNSSETYRFHTLESELIGTLLSGFELEVPPTGSVSLTQEYSVSQEGTIIDNAVWTVTDSNGLPLSSSSDSATVTVMGPENGRPEILTFNLNNGAFSSFDRSTSLDFTHTGSPTEYMSSESPDFSDAEWKQIVPGITPFHTLSWETGSKTVYLRLRNEFGVSNMQNYSDSIMFENSCLTFNQSLVSTQWPIGLLKGSPSVPLWNNGCGPNLVRILLFRGDLWAFVDWGGWPIHDVSPSQNYWFPPLSVEPSHEEEYWLKIVTENGTLACTRDFQVTDPTTYFEIIEPNKNSKWVPGNHETIRWKDNRPIGSPSNIVIQLHNTEGWWEGIRLPWFGESINVPLSSPGQINEFAWEVPDHSHPDAVPGGSLEIGRRVHSIRVSQEGDETITAYSKPFEIDRSIPQLVVTSPSNGDQWSLLSSQTIQWSSIGDVGPEIDILLFTEAQPGNPIWAFWWANGETNDGSYPWDIDEDFLGNQIVPGNRYRIKVQRAGDETVAAWSGIFSIVSSPKDESENTIIVLDRVGPNELLEYLRARKEGKTDVSGSLSQLLEMSRKWSP